MSHCKIASLLALIFLSSIISTAGSYADDSMEELKSRSKESIQKLGKALKSELQAAMKSDGPMAAVQVCNLKAPEIAAALSTSDSISIGRTSLKLRNSKNAPDAWEESVLLEFNKKISEGTKNKNS